MSDYRNEPATEAMGLNFDSTGLDGTTTRCSLMHCPSVFTPRCGLPTGR